MRLSIGVKILQDNDFVCSCNILNCLSVSSKSGYTTLELIPQHLRIPRSNCLITGDVGPCASIDAYVRKAVSVFGPETLDSTCDTISQDLSYCTAPNLNNHSGTSLSYLARPLRELYCGANDMPPSPTTSVCCPPRSSWALCVSLEGDRICPRAYHPSHRSNWVHIVIVSSWVDHPNLAPPHHV